MNKFFFINRRNEKLFVLNVKEKYEKLFLRRIHRLWLKIYRHRYNSEYNFLPDKILYCEISSTNTIASNEYDIDQIHDRKTYFNPTKFLRD